MSEGIQVVEAADLEEAMRARSGPLPAALPVLPLKDAVAYPDTLTPLAVGQERSMKLVDDVLGGERTLVLVASRDPELEEPGPDRLYDVALVIDSLSLLAEPVAALRRARRALCSGGWLVFADTEGNTAPGCRAESSHPG